MPKIISDEIVEKHPSETVSRFFDFALAPEVVAGETLTGTPTLTVIGTADDLTLTSPAISGTKVTAEVAGGKAQTEIAPDEWRTDYKVRATVSTSGSHTLVMEGTLRVEAAAEFA